MSNQAIDCSETKWHDLRPLVGPYRSSSGRYSTGKRDLPAGTDLDVPFSEEFEYALNQFLKSFLRSHWLPTANPPGMGMVICLKRAGRDGALRDYGFDDDEVLALGTSILGSGFPEQ